MNQEALLESITNGLEDRDTLLIWADIEEELGHDAMARTIRLVHSSHLVPAQCTNGYGWRYGCGCSILDIIKGTACSSHNHNSKPWVVGEETYDTLRRNGRNTNKWTSDSGNSPSLTPDGYGDWVIYNTISIAYQELISAVHYIIAQDTNVEEKQPWD